MRLQKVILTLTAILLAGLFSIPASALIYPLPAQGNDIVGEIKIVQSQPGDTLLTLARRNEMGFDELIEANPKLPQWGKLKKDTAVIIPSLFLLPNSPREGIVINLPEKRLYFYPKNDPIVLTEPVAIGIYGWPTPLLDGSVLEKAKNPTWHIPESIQIEREEQGLPPITLIRPGPTNPLGQYAIRLSNRTILIHGTINAESIGRRASHGCIRMYPEDIEQLFYMIDAKIPVRIINRPFKVGWENHHVYLEAHKTLVENRGTVHEQVEQVFNLLMALTNNNKDDINWSAVEQTLIKQKGIPERVSK